MGNWFAPATLVANIAATILGSVISEQNYGRLHGIDKATNDAKRHALFAGEYEKLAKTEAEAGKQKITKLLDQ